MIRRINNNYMDSVVGGSSKNNNSPTLPEGEPWHKGSDGAFYTYVRNSRGQRVVINGTTKINRQQYTNLQNCDADYLDNLEEQALLCYDSIPRNSTLESATPEDSVVWTLWDDGYIQPMRHRLCQAMLVDTEKGTESFN